MGLVKQIIPAAAAYAGVRVAASVVPAGGQVVQLAAGVGGAFVGLWLAKKFAG